MHGGAAPQVKAKALQRLLAAADPAAAELIRLAKKAESETVRRQACCDVLDRAGMKPADVLKLQGDPDNPLELNVSLREQLRSKLNRIASNIGT
jgi:hypothetical protein